jgi:hypothetical protein
VVAVAPSSGKQASKPLSASPRQPPPELHQELT